MESYGWGKSRSDSERKVERASKALGISYKKLLYISKTFLELAGWVATKAKQLKEQKEEEAINLYLHAELTQKEVAERIGVSEAEMSRILQNCKYAEKKDFSPFLYNIWNTSKEDNATKFQNTL